MKKIHKGKQQLLFALLSVFVLLLVCLLQSCQPDGKMVKSGTFGLRLSADTTSLNKGVNSDLKTKGYEDEFEEFLETSDYSILIVKDQKDTVQTFPRYDEMPAEIELAEGAYTLIASKGDNKGAAFENPYFEGSTDFTIRGDMNTYIDVMCTLGNTRVVTESSKEFDDVYEDYTIVIKTPYTSEDGFEIEKGETSPAFFRADKEGTEAEVVVKLKKKGSTEEEFFSSTAPLILERRQNVNIMLKLLEGNQGIGLEVTLDDSMIEVPMDVTIPDYMWGEHDKPELELINLDGDEIRTRPGSFTGNPILKFNMSGGVGSLYVSLYKDDAVVTEFNLSTEQGVADAKASRLVWSKENNGIEAASNDLITSDWKEGYIYLNSAINSLDAPLKEDEVYSYKYSFYGSDATGKEYTTDVLYLNVKVLNAEAPIILGNGSLTASIVEGDELSNDIEYTLEASAKIDREKTVLSINSRDYLLYKETQALESNYGIKFSDVSDAKAIITFPKAFSKRLLVPKEKTEENFKFSFKLYDSKGKLEALEENMMVQAPQFTLESTDLDAFAKSVILRGNMQVGHLDKLSFQYKEEGTMDWTSFKPDAATLSSVGNYAFWLPGLEPEKKYQIRAYYNSLDRVSDIVVLNTEAIGTIPNGDFETWSIATDANGSNAHGDGTMNGDVFGFTLNAPYRCWEIYLPYKEGETGPHWETMNKLTTSEGVIRKAGEELSFWLGLEDLKVKGYPWARYSANSGTIETLDNENGSAALIRTVGWGAGNSAGGEFEIPLVGNKINFPSVVSYSTPGELYLGTYNNQKQNFGIDFNSRPKGFRFDYKYDKMMKGSDRFTAQIVILDDEGSVIAEKSFEGGEQSSWITKEVLIDYDITNQIKKASKFYIRFVSGSVTSTEQDDYPVKPGLGNLTDGEYTGSHLYIDNVELIYE